MTQTHNNLPYYDVEKEIRAFIKKLSEKYNNFIKDHTYIFQKLNNNQYYINAQIYSNLNEDTLTTVLYDIEQNTDIGFKYLDIKNV